MATAKESQDQSNSSDVLITMENLEEYISYQGLTVVGVVSASDPPQALKDMLKAKNAPSLSGGPWKPQISWEEVEGRIFDERAKHEPSFPSFEEAEGG